MRVVAQCSAWGMPNRPGVRREKGGLFLLRSEKLRVRKDETEQQLKPQLLQRG